MSTATIETSTKSKRTVPTPRASGEKAKARQNPRAPAVAKPPKPAEAQREGHVTKQGAHVDSPQSTGGRQHRRHDAGDELAAA